MRLEIKRGTSVVESIRPTNGSIQEVVNAEHVADISFTLPYYKDFYKGDTITISGNVMIAQSAASFEKENERKFNYTIKLVHEGYLLLDVLFLGLDMSNNLTEGEFHLMADAETVIDLLIANLSRDYYGWSKGVIQETETVNHSFANDNCRGVLTKLADTYKTEFWFEGKTIHFTKKGSNSGLSFRYGKGNGLKKLKRNVLAKQLTTRLYVKGSSKNLPLDYPGKNLRLPNNQIFIEDPIKIDRYGIVEGWETFDSIYPKRIGSITSVTDAFTFSDTGIDFDINDHLLPNISAKVVFQTGQLAGWEFEIATGGYNHSTKTIRILKNQGETSIEIPDPNGLKPSVGDKYIVFDIKMPQSYIVSEQNELLVAAQERYNEISDETVNYQAETDRIYLRNNNIKVNLGDYVNIAETNPQIDKNIRVVGITTNILDPFDVQLTLADTVAVANVVRARISQQTIQLAISQNQLNDINRTRQNRKTQAEALNMIFNPDTGKFLNNKLDVDWLTAQLITVGSKAGDFILRITFIPNFQNDVNRIAWSAGTIAHNLLTDHQNGIWSFGTGSVTNLENGKAYYIYASCPFNSNVATIIISELVIAVDEIPNKYSFLLGVLSSVTDGFRVVTNTGGNTVINGGQIKTGIMVNQSGQNVLDLDTRTFFGAFKFSNGQDIQTVTNQIATDLGTTQSNVDAVNNLAANAQTTANNAISSIDALANDNVLTPGEKQALKREFDAINVELPTIVEQAYNYEIDSSGFYMAFNDVVDLLIDPMSNLNISSNINGGQMRSLFTAYYDERTDLLRAITDAAKVIADAADAKAQNALNNANEAKDFINNVLPGNLADLQDQIDGLIETWFYDYAPTLSNIPAVNWTTNAEKDKHLKDLFYNNTDGKGYRFSKNGNAYEWVLLSDSDTAAALALAQQAKDTADSKRRTFVVQPFTPYDAGDLWVQGANGNLMRCISGRLSGAYNSADWDLATKYTDDTVAIQAGAAAGTALSKANEAITDANNVNNRVNEIASDDKLTPSEKQDILKDWQIIQGEKPTIIASAQTYNLAYSAYEGAFNVLSGFLSPLLSNINTTSDVAGQTLRDRFKAYNDAKVDLLKLVSDAAKGLVDKIQVGGRNILMKSPSYEKKITLTANANDYHIYPEGVFCDLVAGETYTLSGKTNAEWLPEHGAGPFPGKASMWLVEPNTTYLFLSGGKTFVAPVSGRYFLRLNLYNPGDVYSFWDIQVQRGNKHTDWSPAPEDIEADYTAKVNAAKIAAQDYALVEATLKREQAKAYADGKVSEEEQARINQAAINLQAAKDDALAKANAAVAAVSIGGRNLILNSDINATVNAGVAGFIFWSGFSERLIPGQQYVFTSKRTSGVYNELVLCHDVNDYGNGQPISENVPFTANFDSKAIRSYHYPEWGTLVVEVIKLEKGNKATDWTPAPEDVQAGIDQAYNTASTANATANAAAQQAATARQEAANAQTQANNAKSTADNVATKTNFLTTTVDGNVVATGTMLVGDALGNNNAGVSGVVHAGAESVRFWAGSTYGNRNTAPFRVQQDGKVYMLDCVVEGNIRAGSIGGFTIGETRIQHGEQNDFLYIGASAGGTKTMEVSKVVAGGRSYTLISAGSIVSVSKSPGIPAAYFEGGIYVNGLPGRTEEFNYRNGNDHFRIVFVNGIMVNRYQI